VSTGPTSSVIAPRPDRMTHRVAVRMLELLRIDAIANPAPTKPARHQLLIPERIRREPIFSQPMRERYRAIEINHRSARSRCRLRMSSSIVMTGWRGGGPRPSEIGGVIHPCRKASTRGVREHRASSAARCADFRTNTVAIGDTEPSRRRRQAEPTHSAYS